MGESGGFPAKFGVLLPINAQIYLWACMVLIWNIPDHDIFDLKMKFTVWIKYFSSFNKMSRELYVNLKILALFRNNSAENYGSEIAKAGKDAAQWALSLGKPRQMFFFKINSSTNIL